MSDTKNILIMHSDSRGAERGFILGIAKYANLNTNWILQKEDPFYRSTRISSYNYLLKNKFDGVFIAGALYEKLRDYLDSDKTPFVISAHTEVVEGVPNVIGGWHQSGKMAARHLAACGLKNFAFCGFDEFCWSRGRKDGFINTVEKTGFTVRALDLKSKIKAGSASREHAKIVKWLNSLTKPVGIMTCNDDLGREVLEICKIENIKVPDEVAIIGSDNDELICNLCHPPLSSIAINNEKAGYEAARLLDNIIREKEKMGDRNIELEPLRLFARQSTNTLAVSEQDIVEAIRYIRKNARNPIRVQDIADAVYISRRVLQRKFKKYLNRSIYDEINRARYSLVEQFLLETNMSISQIAEKLNFSGEQNLARFFKKMRGISPNEFRNKQVPNS